MGISIVKTKKHTKIIKISVFITIVVVLVVLAMHFFFPSYHHETYRGINYYSDQSYMDFGIGFNRYGKIAAQYLPMYENVSDKATYIDFIYSDSGMFFYKSVKVCVGVRYDTDIYTVKRNKILTQGTDFKDDGIVSGIQYRLMDKQRQANGEYLYYIIGCSDVDNAIMHLVLFSTENINRMSECYDCTDVFDYFWYDLHPIYRKNQFS